MLDIFEKETRSFINEFLVRRKKQVWRRWIAVLALPAIIILSTSLAKADKMYFYSPLCLGSWENTNNVEGEPQLNSDSDSDSFNDSTSAILKNRAGQIYCGRFVPSIDGITEVKDIKLKVLLNIESSQSDLVPVDSFESGETLDEEYSEDIIFVFPEEGINESEESFDSQTEEESDAANESEISSPEPSIPQIQEESPPSQENINSNSQEVETAPPAEAPAPVESAPSGDSAPSESAPSSDSGDTSWLRSILGINEAMADSESLSLDDALSVSYSIDGRTWNTLGNVSRYGSVRELEFDLDNINIGDLANFQVAITSLPTLSSDDVIYIDSIWVEAEYDSSIFESVSDVATDVVANLVEMFEKNSAIEEKPKEYEPEIPKLTIRKTDYSFSKSVYEANTIDTLEWYSADDLKELENLERGSANIEFGSDGISVFGECKLDYFTIIVFKNERDYIDNPGSSVYNSALPCNGSFSYTLNDFPSLIKEGAYYVMIGEQSEGPWRPISKIYKMNIESEELEEEIELNDSI